jgi:hypothetical protein
MFGFVIGYAYIIQGRFEETMSKSLRFPIDSLRKGKSQKNSSSSLFTFTTRTVFCILFWCDVRQSIRCTLINDSE